MRILITKNGLCKKLFKNVKFIQIADISVQLWLNVYLKKKYFSTEQKVSYFVAVHPFGSKYIRKILTLC